VADGDVKEARARRTERRLREAIVSLVREKSYPTVVGGELGFAHVGRSALYAHFPKALSRRVVDDVFLPLAVPSLASASYRSGVR
jgi:hypothetical protein